LAPACLQSMLRHRDTSRTATAPWRMPLLPVVSSLHESIGLLLGVCRATLVRSCAASGGAKHYCDEP